jgi:predicted phosphodiesterase
MRYLVFGDVHGNLPALEQMLAVEKDNYDVMICHGDVVNYGPWSDECVALLEREGCICLMGNHEEYYLAGSYPGQNLVAKSFFEFCYPRFRSFGTIARYGTDYEIPGITVRHSLGGVYMYPDSDLEPYGIDRNYIIGHSHHQFHRKVKGFDLYNTGSVGQNRKTINVANYLLADEKGEVELKSLVFDVDLVTDKMEELGYPEICLNYYKQKSRI